MPDAPRIYRPRDRGRPAPEERDFSAELNPEQLAAAAHDHGPLLIIAGAGTGKTRTLVYRVAHLIDRGVPPERILLLTFTRRAAQEMLARAGRGIGKKDKRFPKKETLHWIYSRHINTEIPVEDVLHEDLPQFLSYTQ